MKFSKIGFVASQKPEAIEALKKLKKLYKNVSPNKADIIVALGGDGTILKCLHDYLKKKIPISQFNLEEIQIDNNFVLKEKDIKKNQNHS